MAGAYAKEFEKWLHQGTDKKDKTVGTFDNDSVSMEDSGDEIDNYQTDSVRKERDEQVPILFNDHSGNALNSSRQHCFQDEPPILEPVGYTPFTKSSVHSQGDHERRQTLIESNINRTELYKEKENYSTEPEKCFSTRSKESENIFDKFSLLSEVDDFPPPLIPSHEAHLTTVDAKDDDNYTERSYVTLQNLSPNFCAMEADSTTEMLQVVQNDSFVTIKDTSDKMKFNNDICVECDSTCMLGTSPHVVSPGSVSIVDSDNLNQTPSQEETPISPDENPTIVWNDFSSRETCGLLPPLALKQSNKFVTDYARTNMAADHVDNMRPEQHSFGWDRECPTLEAEIDDNERKRSEHHKRYADVDDPPVLSVIPPTLITPIMSARKKRHTIDTVESLSRPKQRSYSRDFHSKELKHVAQNFCPDASYTESNLNELSKCKKERKKISSSLKRKDSLSRSHSKSHSRPQKHRKRCQTLPIVDLISYGSYLPQDLYSFVVNSSQLSILQNRMHQLVSLLFPQLSSELTLMSPESSRFELLLKHLCESLKEHGGQLSSKSEFDESAIYPDFCLDRIDMEGNNISIRSSSNDASSNISLDVPTPSHENVSCNAAELDQNIATKIEPNKSGDWCHSEMNSNHHQHSSVLSCSVLPENVKSDTANAKFVSDSMIPRLAQLSLTKENEKIVKNQPTVLVHKDPSAVHKGFFKLSCCTLQLLLPDLDVSLSNELAESPRELLHFIDSVIASNLC